MSRINTNVTSLVGQRVLGKNQAQQTSSLKRLSTGLRINSGADDPAGLIASENLRSEKAGIQQGVDNATRAGNIIGTAEGGLNEVSSLLVQLQSLVGQAASRGGLSTEETSANQLQVDSILATVNRISGSTSFQGIQLLNGNFDYTTSSVTATQVSSLRVNSALIPDGSTKAVVINVLQSAQTANITYTNGAIPTGGVTISVAGNKGTQQLSFASGTTVTGIANAINGVKAATGLSAQVSGTALRVNSTGYGSDQYVSIASVSGTFTTSAASGKAIGRDATVNVNGAATTAKGKDVTVRTSTLDAEFSIGNTINNNSGTSTFYITGGGATFALGSKVNETNKASIGIANVSTGSLGNSTLGFLSTLGSGGPNALTGTSLVNAQDILSTAVKQVSQLRGRLGAFQKYTVDSSVNNLGVALENATSAESAIRDTDFAQETSQLTRAQILTQSATTVLTQANSAPQNVLSLLRGG
jgi:flagellin